MQRKNRQLKVNVNIPEQFESDEDFLEALRDAMDDDGVTIDQWNLILLPEIDEDGDTVLPINSIVFNGFGISPEEE